MASNAELKKVIAHPTVGGTRSAWQYRPLSSLTPGAVANILRQASIGSGREFLLAAADIEEKDLHYRAVLQTRKLSIAALPLEIAPADNTRAAKRAADLAQAAIDGIDIHGLLLHLMDAIAKGYAVAEIVWDTAGGQWMPSAVLPREPHWFRFDRLTGRELRLDDGSLDGAPLPAYKFVLHVPHISAGLTLMGGLARSALWAWVFKSYALRDWAAFAEMYGQPIRLGKYDNAASPQDVDTLRRAVLDIGTDAAAVLPASMVVEIVESAGKTASSDLYQSLIEYLDRQVSKCVLGQTMTTDDGSSLSQAIVHNEVRRDLQRADARALAATLLRDLITPVVRLNMGDAPLPQVVLRVDEPEDMAALAAQLEKLVPLGVPVPQAWVMAKWGIPAAAEGEALLGAPAAPGPAPKSAQSAHAARESAPDTPDYQAARLAANVAPAIEAWLEQIRAMLDAADSLEEFRASLLAAYPQLDSAGVIKAMQQAFVAADLAGRYEAMRDSRHG